MNSHSGPSPPQVDVLYYSNYCNHSQRVLQHVAKFNWIDRLSCVNVDKRTRDAQHNHWYVTMENGQKVLLPPGLHSVPTMLCVTKNHTLLTGYENIVAHLQHPPSSSSTSTTTSGGTRFSSESEPDSFVLTTTTHTANIVSEKFTPYGLSPEALSAKGQGTDRALYHYVPVNHHVMIPTPEEKYRADKVSSNVTVEMLQQERNSL